MKKIQLYCDRNEKTLNIYISSYNTWLIHVSPEWSNFFHKVTI